MTAQTRTEGSAISGAPDSIFAGAVRLTSFGLVVLVTLIAFEAQSVATAMPTAARDLHGLSAYGWVFSGFLVANVVGLVVSGAMSDRAGPRRPLILGLVTFCLGLLVAGSASTMTQLIGGRVVQGLGGGLLITAIYVIIGESYPTTLRPKIFAAISSAWVVPSLVGPPLSGFLTQHVTWRAVFLLLAPLVVAGGMLMIPVLRTLSDHPRSAVAPWSRLTRALAVALGLAALVQAGQHPSVAALIAAGPGAAILAWGIVGLVPAGTLRVRRGVPSTVALRGLLAGAMFGAESLIPLALTVQHGYGPTAAGLPLLGTALAWALGSWWQGRDAVAAHRTTLIRTAFVLLAVACTGAAVASVPSAPGWLMYVVWPAAGLGAGLGMSSVGVIMLDLTTDETRGRDSSALQLSDNAVSAFTTGLGGVLVAAAVHSHLSYTAAFVTADLVMAGVALIGLGFAGRARVTPGRR
ncbi:MAG: MFS transporter [bacterium]